jgi:ABC-2 type transport system permease protein
MKRYIKTIWLFLYSAFCVELEYRTNFFLACLSSLLNLAGSVFALSLFFRVAGNLGGWRWEEALIVMGLFTFLDGVATAWLRPNLSEIVRYVREGTMDFILIKPFDSQVWLSTRHLSVWGIPNILFGLALVFFAGIRLHLTAFQYISGIPAIFFGTVILYSLWFLIAATSVFFVKVHNATFVLRSVLEAGRYPVGAYPTVYRLVFTFILPVAFLTTVPAESMLGRADATGVVSMVLLAAIMFGSARFFWRFSLRHYSSASS